MDSDVEMPMTGEEMVDDDDYYDYYSDMGDGDEYEGICGDSDGELVAADYEGIEAEGSDAVVSARKQMTGIIKFDGASKGNPGKAGAGAVLMKEDGTVVSRISEGLGVATNNEAEYRGLTLGLKHAAEYGFKRIEVHLDSQLVCKQVNGEWQTRNQNMRDLCNEVNQLKQNFNSFEMKHVPRGANAEADRQANIGTTLPRGAVHEERGYY